MKAIILFGYGARDSRWREPIERLATLWCDQQVGFPVEVVFLEMMQPSLEEVVSSLAGSGASKIIVVPVFFGQSGHPRNDFPLLLDNL